MLHSTYFVQGCPTCGRRLQIRVEYLGRRVVCQHCRGHFVACGAGGRRCDEAQPAQSLLHRAEELLKRAAERTHAPRHSRPK